MTKAKLITTILLLLQLSFFGQKPNGASVDNILKSDTIVFELLEYGCEHSKKEKIVITKISADKYFVIYIQSDGRLIETNITNDELFRFGQSYKSEMAKKHKCKSTTSTSFILKARNISVEFNYNGCDEKSTPMAELTKRLKL